MALNIANRKVEEKAVQASRILGVNKTAAVEIALEYYLEHHQTELENSVIPIPISSHIFLLLLEKVGMRRI